jgi:hypothetical protein
MMRYGELIELEINQIMGETENQVIKIPADLDRNYEVTGRRTGLVAGAALGSKVGAGIGIALGPMGAIAGTIPGLFIVAVIGYFGGERVGAKFSKED